MAPRLFAASGLLAGVDLRADAAEQVGRVEHPRLLFSAADIASIKERAKDGRLVPYARRVVERAEWLLTAPPLIPSITKRGAADPPGEQKGLACARKLQGRVVDLAMAFTLTGDRRYRDKVVALLDDAIQNWRIWVDTAHPPPYDLMNGELSLTFGLAYDWLYHDLTPDERQRLREGVERRGMQAYLEGATREKPMMWLTAKHNWNPVCNGGATVLALALEGESALSARVLSLAVPAMKLYWDELKDDGGWNEGTGYWTYGHRYGLIAAEALRRTGHEGGAEVFARPGVRHTAAFPIVFAPGKKISASFGDSNGRANDAIFYLLAREYHDADAVWFQDRYGPRDVHNDDWPQDALTLLWRPINEPWLPENQPQPFTPSIPTVATFPAIGWAMMTPSEPDPPFFLAFKNGSLAANHTHLDLNTVNVGVADTLIARELGSRPYPEDYFGPKRTSYYEITTAGHNTVLVGGKGQTPRKDGKLLGPLTGPNYSAVIGIADNAYDVDTPRARRHVVFVDNRYWVLLDEIETREPQPIELRFHTYGTITPSTTATAPAASAGPSPSQWTFTDGPATLDIVSPRETGLAGSVEQPAGWIRPVNVLSLKSTSARPRHAAITVLMPRRPGATAPPTVTAAVADSRIDVAIDRDRVSFTRSPEGWQILSVAVIR